MANLRGRPVVAGCDRGQHAGRPQIVDRGFLHVAVAGRRRVRAGAAAGLQSVAALKRVKTWTAKILPSRATPFVGSPVLWLVLRPAAMPDTCVPCWQRLVEPLMQLAVVESAAPTPVCEFSPFGQSDTPPPPPPALEKQASATTLPLRNSWLACTPVSSTATAQPAP